MYLRQLIFILLIFKVGFAFSQSDCSKFKDDYVPKDLNDAINYLNCVWPDSSKVAFKIRDEKDAVTELHFGAGLAIRNNWGLWAKKRNSLVKYFNSQGLYHPDDISSVILTSFHRILNNMDIDLKGQIQFYKDYWDKVKIANEAKEKKINEQIESEYKAFKVGDTVKIAYKAHVDTFKNVFLYRIQKYPVLNNDESNCNVLGIVKGKKNKKDKYILRILITDICGYNDAYYSGLDDKFKIGEIYNIFNLRFYKITKDK